MEASAGGSYSLRKQEAKSSAGSNPEGSFRQGTVGILVLNSQLAQEKILETEGGQVLVAGNGMVLGMTTAVSAAGWVGGKTTSREVDEKL